MVKEKSKSSILLDFSVRCLAFRSEDDDGRWCAVAIDMDIWGDGESLEEAKSNLEELVDIQIEFAVGKSALNILDHPTEEKWIRLWEEIHWGHVTEQQEKVTYIASMPSSVGNTRTGNEISYCAA